MTKQGVDVKYSTNNDCKQKRPASYDVFQYMTNQETKCQNLNMEGSITIISYYLCLYVSPQVFSSFPGAERTVLQCDCLCWPGEHAQVRAQIRYNFNLKILSKSLFAAFVPGEGETTQTCKPPLPTWMKCKHLKGQLDVQQRHLTKL